MVLKEKTTKVKPADLEQKQKSGEAGKVEDSQRLTMTISEFAEASGISRNLAYDLARRNELGVPVIRLGARMVLSRSSVIALLSGNSQPNGRGADGKDS